MNQTASAGSSWHRVYVGGKGYGWARSAGEFVPATSFPHFESLTEAEKEAVCQQIKTATTNIIPSEPTTNTTRAPIPLPFAPPPEFPSLSQEEYRPLHNLRVIASIIRMARDTAGVNLHLREAELRNVEQEIFREMDRLRRIAHERQKTHPVPK